MIKRENFLNLLNMHPDDFEKFQYLKDEIIINKNFQYLNEKCYSCGSGNHLIENCSYLHFIIKE